VETGDGTAVGTLAAGVAHGAAAIETKRPLLVAAHGVIFAAGVATGVVALFELFDPSRTPIDTLIFALLTAVGRTGVTVGVTVTHGPCGVLPNNAPLPKPGHIGSSGLHPPGVVQSGPSPDCA